MTMRCTCIFLLTVLLLWIGEAQEHNPQRYEWESWNHYEILDLPLFNVTQLRQHYRTQARLWHPDKQQRNSTEATARFARIAQAYEILKDDATRQAYDQSLQQQQSSFYDDWYSSPYDDSDSSHYTDPYASFYDDYFSDSSSFLPPLPPGFHKRPTVVQESEQVVYDVHRHMEVLRVTQTEEYRNDRGQTYLRVLAQDYAMDAWNGQWIPITNLYIQQEAFFQSPRSTLYEGEILTTSLVSPNQRFSMYLRHCQLMVVREADHEIVWQSEDHWYSTEDCFATLQGPYLIVSTGRPERPGRAVWISSSTDEDDDLVWGRYECRLNRDGSLGIYRLQDETAACVFSTGRLGCHKLGQALLEGLAIGRDGVQLGLRQVQLRLNAILERCDWILERLEESELLEHIWAALQKASQTAVRNCRRILRRAVQRLRRLLFE